MRAFILPLLLLVAGAGAAEPAFAVLAFSRTAGFRHGSIAKGHAMLQALARENGFAVDDGEDAAAFTDGGLARYRVVVFLNTTGDVLDDAQQAAFERFIAKGNGFVGIHAATDTEYGWPWYGALVGARFAGHPAPQRATVRVLDRAHPSTARLDATWARTDEWYNFKDVAPGLRVLMELDESSYQGGAMGEHHPICWCHEVAGGRAWYTGLGHTDESYDEPAYRAHVLGGIRWAARVADDAPAR